MTVLIDCKSFLAEPHTEILGGPSIFIEEGATMNLTCVVKESPEPPQYIFWYHNGQPISYSSIRGGISQITEKGDVTASFLLIQEARMEDSGEYLCQASVGNTSTITVHVFKSTQREMLLETYPEDDKKLEGPCKKHLILSSLTTQTFDT